VAREEDGAGGRRRARFVRLCMAAVRGVLWLRV
jgi:hypothetical protein